MKVKANGKTFTFADGTSQEQIGAAIDDYFKSNAPQQPVGDDVPTDERLAQQPSEPKEDQSFIDKAIGVGETALTAITGATTGAAGQLAGTVIGAIGEEAGQLQKGTGDNPLTSTPSEGQQLASDWASALTYAPKTEAGQEIAQELGGMLEGIPPYLGMGATANVSSIVNQLKTPLKGGVKEVLGKVAPTNEQLKAASTALYKEIDDAAVKIPRNDYQNFAMRLNNKLRSRGLDEQLTPKANAVLNRVADDLQNGRTGLSDLERVRRLAGTASQDFNNPTDQALGVAIKDTIDDFVENGIGKVDGGDAASTLYKGARNLVARRKKSEAIDEAVLRAEQARSGFENGLRGEFSSLLKNRKKRSAFNAEEKKAMNQITQGGSLENKLKKLSKLGVGADQQTNVLLGYLGIAGGIGGGAALGGTLGAIAGGLAFPVIGQVSATAAKNLANKNQKFLSSLTRAGKNGGEIVKAYMDDIPKKNQSREDLAKLLLDPTVDMSTVRDMAKNYKADKRLVDDAIFIADRLKNAQLAAYAAQTSIGESNGEEQKNQSENESQ